VTAWLTLGDSNYHIPSSKKPLNVGGISAVLAKIRLGGFCSYTLHIEKSPAEQI